LKYMCVFQTFQVLRNFTILYNKGYQQMRLFLVKFLYLLFLVFPTCFRLLPAHHQGYIHLLFMCCHLVRVMLCWATAQKTHCKMAAKFLLADTCVAGAHSSGWVSDSCHTFLPHPALPHHSFTIPSRPSLPQHSVIYTSPSPAPPANE